MVALTREDQDVWLAMKVVLLLYEVLLVDCALVVVWTV